MSDRDALLRAIVENPGEDTPKLALADWLEEHGGPADRSRSGFIRDRFPPREVGAGLVRPVGMRPWARYARSLFDGAVPRAWLTWLVPSPDDPRWSAVKAAGGWGVWAHRDRFRSSAPPLVVALRHGFATWVATDHRRFVGHAAALFRTQPVTSVAVLDRAPSYTAHGWCWVKCGPGLSRARAALARPLFNRLVGGTAHVPPRRAGAAYRLYPDRLAAYADLSAACVAFGRWAAGLPPLA